MIRVGLSSTALLTRGYRDVIDAAKGAGLDAVEWAGEAHAPLCDSEASQQIMIDTLRAGLTVASWAPLYRLGLSGEHGLRFEALLGASGALQAPCIRVYVGLPSDSLDSLAAEARRLGDLAAEKGLTLCLSFGRATWLSSYKAAWALLAAVDHPFVRLAWEPLPGVASEESTRALESLAPMTAMLIVRSLGRDGHPARPEIDEAQWRRRLAAFANSGGDPDMSRFALIGAVHPDCVGPDCAGSVPVGMGAVEARGDPDGGADGTISSIAEDFRFIDGLAAELEGRAGPRRRTR